MALRFTISRSIFGFVCVVILGCGGASSPMYQSAERMTAGDGQPGPPAQGGKPGDAPNDNAIVRRIIYTANIELVVKEIEHTQAELMRIVEESKGYISKSDVAGYVGSRRTATWTIKVPVEHFQRVMNQLSALGKVTKNSSDSQDVTEEFVDLQARIKNLKAEEEILNKFLKESVASVENYLKTREQIKNVRSEIERAEGRLKYLTTMSAMSSITVTARESEDYDPTPPPAAATFNDDIDSTFTKSWKSLKQFGQGIFLVLVALTPWSPFILIGLLGGRWAIRRMFRPQNSTRDRKASIPVAHRVPNESPSGEESA